MPIASPSRSVPGWRRTDRPLPMAVELPTGPPLPARRSAASGRRKAAVLLVALGSEHAAEVFKHLREEEIESLSLEMAKLQNVGPDTTGSVLEEFAATVTAY